MFEQLANLPTAIKQYLIITGNYWAFTLTDGALRMLVVLHFHQLGYGALAIAMLFLFYEIFGVITNLVGGWLGAHLGLNKNCPNHRTPQPIYYGNIHTTSEVGGLHHKYKRVQA